MKGTAQLDTNYVETYQHKLVASIFQSYRHQNLNITQSSVQDTAGISRINYRCSSKLVQGFAFDWDKISIALSWKTPNEEDAERKFGKSSVKNLALAVNARNIRFEGSYRYYKGFYDRNTINLPSFNDSLPYFQNEGLGVRTFKVKGIYFRNKKKRFSYKAAYANTQRQLKSAATFVLISNLYYQEIKSDQGIIPYLMNRDYYQNYRDARTFSCLGLSLSPGFSVNLVAFKRIFLNGTLAWGPQLMHRRVLDENDDPTISELKLQFNSGDTRASLGYNGKKFLIYTWIMADYDVLDFSDMDISREFISGGLTIGYRFDVKETAWQKRLKENRWYKRL